MCDFDMGLEIEAASTNSVSTFSASSTREGSSPDFGRLNYEEEGRPVAWQPAQDIPDEYLQVRTYQ